MDHGDRFERVAPEFDPGRQFVVGGPDVDRVATHPEFPALKRHVTALVVDRDQLLEQLFARQCHAAGEPDHHRLVVFRRTEAVDARDAGHHDHITPAHQSAGGGQPQPIDLLVDRRILLDVDIALRNVGFGLVVVVVADEIVDGVVGEKIAKLSVELRCQGFVVGEHQCRPADPRNHIGHRECLAGAGHAHQHLRSAAILDSLHERFNGLRLIPRRLIGAHQLKHIRTECHGVAPGVGMKVSGRRWGRMRSSVVSPIPGTSRIASGVRNGPWA